MRVYISADAEGATSLVSSAELYPGEPEYDFCRQMMTADVNAAIEGAFDGGADTVVVNDAHWNMRNILPKALDPRAELIRGRAKRLGMMEGIEGADAVFFVGYHARVGDSDGVGNETILGRELVTVRMNGANAGEAEINAAIAAHFGVPVVMASGDDIFKKEIRRTLPSIEFAVTKYAIDRWAARCLSPEVTRSAIAEAARAAIKRVRTAQVTRMEGPVTFEVDFVSSSAASAAFFVPGAVRKGPRTAAFTGEDILEARRGLTALLVSGQGRADRIYG